MGLGSHLDPATNQVSSFDKLPGQLALCLTSDACIEMSEWVSGGTAKEIVHLRLLARVKNKIITQVKFMIF